MDLRAWIYANQMALDHLEVHLSSGLNVQPERIMYIRAFNELYVTAIRVPGETA